MRYWRCAHLTIANIIGSIDVTPRCSDGWSVLFSKTFFIMNIMCSMNWVFSSLTITWKEKMNHGLYLVNNLTNCNNQIVELLLILTSVKKLKREIFLSSTIADKNSYLALLVKELIHNDFNLVKKNWIQQWWHLMANQLLHMLLNLGSKLLIVTD